jgi:hypothetical protein
MTKKAIVGRVSEATQVMASQPLGRIPQIVSLAQMLQKGKDAMRRLLPLAGLMLLLQVAVGCRHIAGQCDCEHANNGPIHAVPYAAGHPISSGPVVSQPASQSSPPVYTSNSTVILPR